MGVPASEVGYTPAMPRREDHEVHKDFMVLKPKFYQLTQTMVSAGIFPFRENSNIIVYENPYSES